MIIIFSLVFLRILRIILMFMKFLMRQVNL
uniref:Uncharacterized protein n=1 Tax=Siphoviridae sp. ct2vX3 TaxID=2825318 RepID=A0A8S5PZ31_9CAUD|nr:MAG TPA: hypothetical protein [Siphoviridae sp. ct2vX3]